jgi:hypothetical protein
MAHQPRRKISIPQEGGDITFRGPDEIAGNSALTKALAADTVDSLQVNEIYSVVSLSVTEGSVIVAAPSPVTFGAAVGDFLTIEGVDGYFIIASIGSAGPNFAMIVQNSSFVTNGAGAIAGNTLSDGTNDYGLAGIQAGDVVHVIAGRNREQFFNVVTVSGFSLTIDGTPVADTAFLYNVYRPPQRPRVPFHSTGSGIRIRIAKAPVSGRGSPSFTRLPGFGDASLSSVINRSVRAVAQNTRFLKSILESRIAIPTRHEVAAGHGGTIDVVLNSVIETGGAWTGEIGGTVVAMSAEISKIIRVVDPDGFDIEVGGVDVKVDDLRSATGGGGISLLNRGFVRVTEDAASFVARLNLTIPTAQAFVVIFGKGESLEDLATSDRGAFMKGETLLTGISDEEIPELTNARTSDRFGTYGGPNTEGLDARLESVEDRLTMWSWIDGDPNFRFGPTSSTVRFDATSIVYDGVIYASSSGTLALPGAQGHIRALLNTTGNVLSFDTIASTFDPESLSGTSPRNIVVGVWDTNSSRNLLYTFNKDSKDSDFSFAKDPQFEITPTAAQVFQVEWKNNFEAWYRGKQLFGQSSAATFTSLAGDFNLAAVGASPRIRIRTDDFYDLADGVEITFTSATLTAAQVVSEINTALISTFPHNQIATAEVSPDTTRFYIRSVLTGNPVGAATIAKPLQILAPTGGQDARSALFGTDPGDDYVTQYKAISLGSNIGLFLQLIEGTDGQYGVQFITMSLPVGLNAPERRNDAVLVGVNRSGKFYLRGSSGQYENFFLARPNEVPEEVLSSTFVENPAVSGAESSPNDSLLSTAARSPDGIGIAWLDNAAAASRDIYFARVNESGRLISAAVLVADISTLTPVSDDPTDIAMTYRESDNRFVIVWGDKGTNPGIFTVVVDTAGAVISGPSRPYSTAAVAELSVATIGSTFTTSVVAWIETFAAPTIVKAAILSATGAATVGGILTVDNDSISKEGITISTMFNGLFDSADYLIFYGKENPSIASLSDIQVSFGKAFNSGGFYQFGKKGAFNSDVTGSGSDNVQMVSSGRLSAVVTPRQTIALLVEYGAGSQRIHEFNGQGDGLGFLLELNDAAILGALSTLRRSISLVTSARYLPGVENQLFIVATSGGTGFVAGEIFLGAIGWSSAFYPTLNTVMVPGRALQTFKQELVGVPDFFVHAEERGFRVERFRITHSTGAGAPGAGTPNPTAHTRSDSSGPYTFQRTFTEVPKIYLQPITTGTDIPFIIWSVDGLTNLPTAQDFHVFLYNASTGTMAGSQNIAADVIVVGR